jgi:outer membrane lipoprotein-sorting protein
VNALVNAFVLVSWLSALTPVTPDAAVEAAQSSDPADPEARLSALLARFREIEGLSAKYREEKHMDLLVEPLVSSGSLYYARPNWLARHQREPTRTQAVLRDDVMWFQDGAARERLDLPEHSAVRMFVDSILLVLAGDGSRLARLYAVEFREGGGRWSLTLRPKVKPLNRIIDSIRITGRDVVIEHMLVREKSGDVTKTEFVAVDPNHRFTPSERKRVFRLDRAQSNPAP